MDIVPTVLLGMPATLIDDLGCSTADIVYGAPLHLPGEFFSPFDDTLPNAINYTNQLRTAMQGFEVTPTHTPSSHPVFIPQEFSTCTHVFVMQQPYDGPYKVLQCSEKTFMLDIKGGRDTVSIDRLKPVFLDAAPGVTISLTNSRLTPTTLLVKSFRTPPFFQFLLKFKQFKSSE